MTDHIVAKTLELVEQESGRLDANETAHLERQLTQLRAKEFDVLYAESAARQLMPKATDIASSASNYVYKIYDSKGAAIIGGPDGDDSPRVDAEAREEGGKVYPIRAAYGWGIDEMREAARTRTPLSDRKQKAALNAVERGIDGMLFDGVLNANRAAGGVATTGLENAPGVADVAALTDWTDATDPAVITAELTRLMNAIMVGSNGLFHCSTIGLPLEKFAIANSKPVGVDNQESVLSAFKRSNPGVSVIGWWKLTKAVAYQNDNTVLEAVIPAEFESLAPQARNYEIVINCQARCGGVKVYYPDAMRYGVFTP